MPHIGERQLRLNCDQTIDIDGHILVLGKAIELAGNGSRHVEVEPARLIEDERAQMTALDRIAFASRLHGAEQIVEVGPVPSHASAPIVAPVFRVEVNALLGGDGVGRRLGCRQGYVVELQRV